MNTAFRLLLTINATSLLLIVFMVHKGYTLGHFFDQCLWLLELSNAVSHVVYLLVPILLTGFSLLSSRFVGDRLLNNFGQTQQKDS